MSDKLPPKILVIEPNETSNANLCNTIERYWFDVTRVKSAETAVRAAEVNPPNVVVISSRVQNHSASEVAAKLRKIPNLETLPMLFLMEEGESTKNHPLYPGDYSQSIYRPFTPNELMTTIRSILRQSNPTFQDKFIKHNDISMDLSTYKVYRQNKQIHLGPTEFKILQLLVQNPQNVYTRNQIIDYVWGTEKEIAHRTIDVHINRIRTLMKLDTDDYHVIKTIRSAGYCLD